MKFWHVLLNGWVWKMAWRDSRSSRRRLSLALATVTLGIAALIAIRSFEANVRTAIHHQAKALLGADLALSSRQPFSSETTALINTLGGEQSREVRCSSMAYFPKSGGTRLVQVRALAGDFPYYGVLETLPATAAQAFKTGPYAVVDDSLMLQFDAQVGDALKIGAFSFRIIGRLNKVPGEAAAAALIGPRVYIPMAYLDHTELIQTGSRARYTVYFKFNTPVDIEPLLENIHPHLIEHHVESDTVQERAASLGQAMEHLTRFLNLVGFLALLLGGVGIASAVHVYIKQKFDTIAILRCMGANARQTFAIYVIQTGGIGLIGAVCGALIGIVVQTVLPSVLRDFLPVRMSFAVAWGAVLQGMVIGLGMTLLFALLPLLSIRRVTPLRILRLFVEEPTVGRQDPLRWLTLLLIALSISAFALAQTERWTHGLGFVAGLGAACGLLAGIAHLIMQGVRTYFPNSWAYVWRQGLANLYRPNNQTLILLLSLGMGTCLILTVYFVQSMVLKQVALSGSDNQPNLVLFDIQTDQRAGVASLVRSFGLPVLHQAPIVTMRLAAIKGRRVADLRSDDDSAIPEWALQWEYRATYRKRLIETETLVAGTWHDKVGAATDSGDAYSSVPISLEEGIADTLGVTLGDELVFDVQGVPIVTTVGSMRKVNWQRIRPNFFIVFPTGVLEQAPQFFIFVSRVNSNPVSAQVQRMVVQRFPNVSVIDLTLILQTAEAMLEKISFAIRFMAFFSVVTGFVVLISTAISGRHQRLRESVLLRTLGASRTQIRTIMLVEYLFLGSLAALAGLLLALVGSWALTAFLFEIDTLFTPPVFPLLITLLLVIGLTTLIGTLSSRGICDHPPLEVLRSDA